MAEKIYRAGMILYHFTPEKTLEMLFMKPSDPNYGGPRFQITKGKVEPGESAVQAAIREAQEEVGLFPGNIEGDIHELGRFLGRTDFFVAKIKDKNAFGLPNFETGEVKWMTPEQFDEEGRSLHKPVVKAAVRLIANLEKSEETDGAEQTRKDQPKD